MEHLRPTTKNRYFKTLNPWYRPYTFKSKNEANSPKEESDDVLIFESRFESGNLKKAI